MKKYNQANTRLSRQKGMTLIELTATTVILVAIASAAVPSMRGLFERKNVPAIAEFFSKSVKLARVEAIQRSVTVRVIPLSGTGDWAEGWNIVFTDIAGNDNIIRTFPALSGNPIFTSESYDADNDLSILPTGQVLTPGTLIVRQTGCSGDEALSINILLSGLVQKQVSACP
jgi:prepilin-type N-terminal cleavage/methylation domain-containing protein